MSLILNIETATRNCSVSLAENGQLIALKEFSGDGYTHGENLHVFIKEVFQTSGVTADQLSAVAVSKGPGSYTGLRIGVSAAKGLCFSLDIPLIAIPTLQILAMACKENKSGYIVPILDARRMEVYSAIFDAQYNMLRAVKAEIIDSTSFQEILHKDEVCFLGDAVEKTQKVIKHSNAHFIEEILPSAKEMVEISFKKFQHQEFEDVAYLEPFYLKDFIGTVAKR